MLSYEIRHPAADSKSREHVVRTVKAQMRANASQLIFLMEMSPVICYHLSSFFYGNEPHNLLL